MIHSILNERYQLLRSNAELDSLVFGGFFRLLSDRIPLRHVSWLTSQKAKHLVVERDSRRNPLQIRLIGGMFRLVLDTQQTPPTRLLEETAMSRMRVWSTASLRSSSPKLPNSVTLVISFGEA